MSKDLYKEFMGDIQKQIIKSERGVPKDYFENKGKYFDSIKKWTKQYKEALDNGQV